MKQSLSFRSAFSPLMGLALAAGVAVTAQAASTAASSASDSASSATSSASNSIGQSSNSSSRNDLAAGQWRILDVAELPAEASPDGRELLALTLQAESDGTELVLRLPRALARHQVLAAGDRLDVRRQGWGFALARAGVDDPFFLVLDDARHRELGSRQVTL